MVHLKKVCYRKTFSEQSNLLSKIALKRGHLNHKAYRTCETLSQNLSQQVKTFNFEHTITQTKIILLIYG